MDSSCVQGGGGFSSFCTACDCAVPSSERLRAVYAPPTRRTANHAGGRPRSRVPARFARIRSRLPASAPSLFARARSILLRPCQPASLASAHAIPSLLAFARFRPPAAQIEVFGNNLRPLHRLWQLFPLAAMDALGTNFLTRHFAWKAFGKGRNSALARSREEHSTEIMVKNPETICKFGNYFRWVLQRRHAEGHTIAEGRSP